MALTPLVYEYLHDPDVTEFECSDCNLWVIGFGAVFIRLPPRCATCEWLADIVDPAEREQLREWLAERG